MGVSYQISLFCREKTFSIRRIIFVYRPMYKGLKRFSMWWSCSGEVLRFQASGCPNRRMSEFMMNSCCKWVRKKREGEKVGFYYDGRKCDSDMLMSGKVGRKDKGGRKTEREREGGRQKDYKYFIYFFFYQFFYIPIRAKKEYLESVLSSCSKWVSDLSGEVEKTGFVF